MLASERVLRNIPVTLVNEYESSMEAKAKIFLRLQRLTQTSDVESSRELVDLISEMRQNALPLGVSETGSQLAPSLQGTSDIVAIRNLMKSMDRGLGVGGAQFDASVMPRKGIYDKVAASVILQRFLDFYNSDDDLLVVNPKAA